VRVARPQKEKQWKKPVRSIRRNAQENEMRCFECEGVGHQCRDCPITRKGEGGADGDQKV